jgi:NAD(P)H dehydrogenase (quinone)
MNILYVYAHPNPNSFNNSLKQKGCEALETLKHKIILSDLYAESFKATASWDDFELPEIELPSQYFMSQKVAYDKNALSNDIKNEIEKISWADHIIFQFPLWWFSTPAMLKGWLDRILVKGFAYDSGKVFADGLLQGKTAAVVVTTQSPEEAYQLDGMHGCPIDAFLHSFHHTLKFTGIKTLTPFIVYGAFDLDQTKQVNILDKYQNYLTNI